MKLTLTQINKLKKKLPLAYDYSIDISLLKQGWYIDNLHTIKKLLISVIDDVGTPEILIQCGIDVQMLLSISPEFITIESGYGIYQVATCKVHCYLNLDLYRESMLLIHNNEKYSLIEHNESKNEHCFL